ncbi:MAG: ParB/RepB/Spo0J family partition protein [Ignavibacteriales bacterium]|nr:ParB/RepB/Spo0J family partition protein [Ignavibacteriales bacterium]
MQTIQLSLDDVKPHPKNVSIYGDATDESKLQDLITSMYVKGQLTPIVINQNFEIISGHRRVAAARSLKMQTIEAIKMNLNAEEEDTLIVSHNIARKKTCAMIIAEYAVIKKTYGKGQGKRTDLAIPKDGAIDAKWRDVNKLAADMLNISEGSLSQLRTVHKRQPKLLKEIDAGRMTINAAHTLVESQEKSQGNKGTEGKAGRAYPNPSRVMFTLNKSKDIEAILTTLKKLIAKYQKEKNESLTLEKVFQEAVHEHEKVYRAHFDEEKRKMAKLFEDIDTQLKNGQCKIFTIDQVSGLQSETELEQFKQEMKTKHEEFRTDTRYLNKDELKAMRVQVMNDIFQTKDTLRIKLSERVNTAQFEKGIKLFGVDYLMDFSNYLYLEQKARSNKLSSEEMVTVPKHLKQSDKMVRSRVYSLFS